ncbi:MAG: cytochrome c [Deltaproteobacteria bacterium]|nr:cytochrome c [Deltaproteobacteria bacterium]
MKNLLKFAVLIIVALFLTTSRAYAVEPDHGDHKRHDQAAVTTANALIDEMRALDAAFRDIVSGVAVNDGHKVLLAIETLHGSMEKTRHALHAGEVKLSRNPHKMKEFEKFDKEFHGELEALARAAERDDRKVMASLTKKLLDGCVRCHGEFRK